MLTVKSTGNDPKIVSFTMLKSYPALVRHVDSGEIMVVLRSKGNGSFICSTLGGITWTEDQEGPGMLVSPLPVGEAITFAVQEDK